MSRVVVLRLVVVGYDAGVATAHMVAVIDFGWCKDDIIGMNKLLVVEDMRKSID